MSESQSPFEAEPPSVKKITRNIFYAIAAALVLLIVVVLPAEYDIDITGLGGVLGLTELNESTTTLEIVDVLGGNEAYKEVEIPDFGEPIPLPNPAVFQQKDMPALSQSLTILLQPEEQTEIKLLLSTNQVIDFGWSIDQGQIYVDFHGHEPDAGDDYWVRYREHQEGSEGYGSLVAPFDGEHGWYFLNYNEYPVTISMEVSGYYEELIDYGVWGGF